MPEKKVELKQIKENLESQLPQTTDEWWKNLQRNLSRNKWYLIPIIGLSLLVAFPLIGFFTNLFKLSDYLPIRENPSVNKTSQIPNPYINQSPIKSPTQNPFSQNSSNTNVNSFEKEEEIEVYTRQSAKAISNKLIITVNAISFEKNSGNDLVHKITGTMGEIGKKPINFTKRELGYIERLKIDEKEYEIRLIKIDTFYARFLISNIKTQTPK
ncbi:MAG TPA: hypothetical protein PKY59_16725 [Pyrinomonadaceae bacterium]|nr:hypothetical protein [Pyrinomonadaceae bacterium]